MGISGLQLILVFLLSATFVGFLYIGFYAFIITGVIILLYILQQRGVFDVQHPAIEKSVTIEDNSTESRLSGQFREGKYFERERTPKRNGWYKLFLLIVTAAVPVAYYILHINGIMALLLIFILLILFIKESNKT